MENHASNDEESERYEKEGVWLKGLGEIVSIVGKLGMRKLCRAAAVTHLFRDCEVEFPEYGYGD